ncbi:CinA family protein [Mucilaginibacter lutimaris]|uniref:CinA family protein n=1 Tax=Mucilaginibacter lutimaris TaxID=931629 RepID=A0ABW2ZDN2_9SPHI
MPSKSVLTCAELLMDKKLYIAFAESATGGRLSAEFSLVPHCGQTLKGGIACYDAKIKQDILGVSKELIDKYTPESAEVTKDLAEKLGSFIPSDIQVAVTGLTMPGGSETPEKPVGTMFIHAIVNGEPIAVREVYKGSAEDIVLQTVERAAQLITDKLND